MNEHTAPPRPPLLPVPSRRIQAALEAYGMGWQQRGACAPDTAGLFYGPDHQEPPAATRRRTAAAKAICAGCPVLARCREYGLAAREPYGIWGGLTKPERDRIHHTRQAGEAA